MKNALAKVSIDHNDPVVYHYCSSMAFESIIESGCFWATDLRSMNDPREVKSSISTVLKFLEDMRFIEGSPSAELLDHTTRAFNKYNGFVRFFAPHSLTRVMICILGSIMDHVAQASQLGSERVVIRDFTGEMLHIVMIF